MHMTLWIPWAVFNPVLSLHWFRQQQIPRPAFVFKLDALNGNGVGAGVQIGKSLILRRPAAVHVVRANQLPCFVVEFDQDILPELVQRHFRSQAGAQFPNQVGPVFKGRVFGQSTFHGDGVKLRQPGRLPAGRRIASLAMLNNAGGPNQSRDARDSGNVCAVPFHAKVEVLVGIVAGRIYAEFCHATEHSIAGRIKETQHARPRATASSSFAD